MELLQGKRLQFLILSDYKVVDLALFSRGKFFKNHVTLGIMVNSQKLLGRMIGNGHGTKTKDQL